MNSLSEASLLCNYSQQSASISQSIAFSNTLNLIQDEISKCLENKKPLLRKQALDFERSVLNCSEELLTKAELRKRKEILSFLKNYTKNSIETNTECTDGTNSFSQFDLKMLTNTNFAEKCKSHDTGISSCLTLVEANDDAESVTSSVFDDFSSVSKKSRKSVESKRNSSSLSTTNSGFDSETKRRRISKDNAKSLIAAACIMERNFKQINVNSSNGLGKIQKNSKCLQLVNNRKNPQTNSIVKYFKQKKLEKPKVKIISNVVFPRDSIKESTESLLKENHMIDLTASENEENKNEEVAVPDLINASEENLCNGPNLETFKEIDALSKELKSLREKLLQIAKEKQSEPKLTLISVHPYVNMNPFTHIEGIPILSSVVEQNNYDEFCDLELPPSQSTNDDSDDDIDNRHVVDWRALNEKPFDVDAFFKQILLDD